MKRILWVSKHKPLLSQVRELERLYGYVEIVQDPSPFDSAEDIAKRARGYDDVVVVAPLWVIAKLCALGINPLYAEMKCLHEAPEHPDPDREVKAGKKWYRFERFRRIVGVEVKFEELK